MQFSFVFQHKYLKPYIKINELEMQTEPAQSRFLRNCEFILKTRGGGDRPHTRQWGMKTSSHGIKLIFLSTLADIFLFVFLINFL